MLRWFSLQYLYSWTNYYGGADVTSNIASGIRNEPYKHSELGNFYVSKVTFKDLAENKESGGAIHIISTSKVLIESTSFLYCSSAKSGGAISCEGGLQGCVLNMICSNGCYSKKLINFCKLITENEVIQKNYIDHSSIVNTSYTTDETIELVSGEIRLEYDNVSKNVCHAYSAIYFMPDGKTHFSYTAFEGNKAKTDVVDDYTSESIIFCSLNQQFDINTCNLIDNDAYKDSCGIICICGPLKIVNSYIKNNNVGKAIFAHGSKDGKSNVDLINTYIDNVKTSNNMVVVKGKSIQDNGIQNDLSNQHNDECILDLSSKTKSKKCKPIHKCNMIQNYPRVFLSLF